MSIDRGTDLSSHCLVVTEATAIRISGRQSLPAQDQTLWHPDLGKATPSKLFMMLLDYSKDAKGEPGPDPTDGVMYVITEVAQYSLKDYFALKREMPGFSYA